MDEIDVWRTAKLLMDTHGDTAAMEAAMRADSALDNGELAAVNVWKRVMRAVEDLQRTAPRTGARAN